MTSRLTASFVLLVATGCTPQCAVSCYVVDDSGNPILTAETEFCFLRHHGEKECLPACTVNSEGWILWGDSPPPDVRGAIIRVNADGYKTVEREFPLGLHRDIEIVLEKEGLATNRSVKESELVDGKPKKEYEVQNPE